MADGSGGILGINERLAHTRCAAEGCAGDRRRDLGAGSRTHRDAESRCARPQRQITQRRHIEAPTVSMEARPTDQHHGTAFNNSVRPLTWVYPPGERRVSASCAQSLARSTSIKMRKQEPEPPQR